MSASSVECVPIEEYFSIAQSSSSEDFYNSFDDGTGHSLVSRKDGTYSDGGFEYFDDYSTVLYSNARKIVDERPAHRLFRFELLEENKSLIYDPQLTKNLGASISYLFIGKSKVENNVLNGVLYKKNRIVIGNLESKFQRLKWTNFKSMSVDSLCAFEVMYQEKEVLVRWGQKPMNNSEKGRKSQMIKRQNQSISMTKDIENIMISPLSEKSIVNRSSLNLTSMAIFSDCNFYGESLDDSFLNTDATITSDITKDTNFDYSAKVSSVVPQSKFSSNICPICERCIGFLDGECKLYCYSNKIANYNIADNAVCGYPDQLNLACIDNICFIVMITMHFLNPEGQDLFKKVNEDLYCNLKNLLWHYEPAIVLKSQLIKLIGYNIRLDGPPLDCFDILENHECIDFITGIDALFTHSSCRKNIFDILIEGNYSCNNCGKIIYSETVQYRTLKCDSNKKRNFEFNDLFKDNGTDGSNRFCTFCDRDNPIGIHNSRILNKPLFIFIIYTTMNSYEDKKSLHNGEDNEISKTIYNKDVIEFSLIGYSYQKGSEFYSNSYHPFRDSIIQYDGKKNSGVVSSIRNRSFITSEDGLGIYINENYFDRNKLVITNYDETEEIKELNITKKMRCDIVIPESDLYVKESDHITLRLKSIGKGLFCEKVIPVGARLPYFKGVIISLKEYLKKPTNEIGYGFEIIKDELVLDCYSNTKICMASYANNPKKLMHRVTHAEPIANTKCFKSKEKNSTGNVVFFLEAIKEIGINEEILWTYDEIDDKYFE